MVSGGAPSPLPSTPCKPQYLKSVNVSVFLPPGTRVYHTPTETRKTETISADPIQISVEIRVMFSDFFVLT